jgi:hypothetical protein
MQTNSKNTATKIDTSIPGWFRALRAVDSMFQSWVCIGWFQSQAEAEAALSK